MKSELECLVCMMNQAMRTARIATDDPAKQEQIMKQVGEQIRHIDLSLSPAINSQQVYRLVSELTGNEDPYADIKQQTNLEALKYIPQLREMVNASPNPLYTALQVSVAGNSIDFGIGQSFDLKEIIDGIINTPFAVDHFEMFMLELNYARSLLFLGDNSGEIIFDRLLVEELLKIGVQVTYCVKSGPVINDATMADAVMAGLTEIVPVIETGSNAIGVDFTKSGESFQRALEQSNIMIGKGHGNFETCLGTAFNIYFLLKAKCPVVAEALGVKQGDIAFSRNII